MSYQRSQPSRGSRGKWQRPERTPYRQIIRTWGKKQLRSVARNVRNERTLNRDVDRRNLTTRAGNLNQEVFRTGSLSKIQPISIRDHSKFLKSIRCDLLGACDSWWSLL